MSRRALLTRGAALSAVGLGVARVDAADARSPSAASQLADSGHQPGIATPRPASVVLAAFDLQVAAAAGLVELLKRWTVAIRAVSTGRLSDTGDSGETAGLRASGVTVTLGFGPGVFDARLGVESRRPAGLVGIPRLVGDAIDAGRSNGDIVVQACAADATVALHAVRQLERLARGAALLRWLTTGYAAADARQCATTARNLLGFKDGTANPPVGAPPFGATVWVTPRAGPSWMVGGTYLCYRKIRIDLEAWDRLTVPDQQVVIGRRKSGGAPLSGGSEDSPLRLDARSPDGTLAIPAGSHVRVASPQMNAGATMFRRSFSYADGVRDGAIDAGQLFVAFVADPRTQFIPVLRRLSETDRLGQFTTHLASGLWAVPPAATPGGWLGETLLG